MGIDQFSYPEKSMNFHLFFEVILTSYSRKVKIT